MPVPESYFNGATIIVANRNQLGKYPAEAKMKKCFYCNTENEDSAILCKKCGLSMDKPDADGLPFGFDPNKQSASRFGIRLLASFIVGLAVCGLSLNVAWRNVFYNDAAKPEQRLTQYHLEEIKTEMTNYEEAFGTFPKSLADLPQLNKSFGSISADSDERLLDGWKRPLLLTNTGKGLVAISFDGKPGGEGLDFDLTTTNIFDSRPIQHSNSSGTTCRPER